MEYRLDGGGMESAFESTECDRSLIVDQKSRSSELGLRTPSSVSLATMTP